MKLIDLIARAGLALNAPADLDITGLCTDTRRLERGNLFIALSGTQADGASFAAEAVQKGAAALLSDKPLGLNIPCLTHPQPRLALAKLAAAFYSPLPQTLVAVTGTNGKTSIAHFTMQLWNALGHKAAALGTMGITGKDYIKEGSLTTPDPITLAADLHDLYQRGYSHAALEASSHGLDQYRLDGLTLAAAGHTYIGRDHLDYHGTPANYAAAKAQLFNRLLPATGTAVLNMDVPEYTTLHAQAVARGQNILRYGMKKEAELCLHKATPLPQGIEISATFLGHDYQAILPLIGTFQAHNILCALGLVMGSGTAPADAIDALSALRPVRGRMERVSDAQSARGVYVDYAHTPDALETVIKALRPHTQGKLTVIFGCGGNRDRGKRPLMGKIAAELADAVIITDDNPRFEDAAFIRQEVLQGAPDAQEIGDRQKAIQTAIKTLQDGDTILLAGKGHEQGQLVAGEVLPFDDAAIARAALKEMRE